MNATLSTTSSPLKLDPRTYARGLSCVHCGLCLPACPTYTQNGNEADSPRGRIQLMLALSDGTIDPTESVRKHLDLCLDCRACETACPSGVVYHELIEETRTRLRQTAKPGPGGWVFRWFMLNVLTRPTLLKLLVLPARLLRSIGAFNLLPRTLRKMGQMLPATGPWWPKNLPKSLPPIRNSQSAIRDAPTVAFFTGCVGSALYSEVNRKAVELLQACGATVTVTRDQVCCGAVHHHNGEEHGAADLARRNIDAFLGSDGVAPDFITATIAGCGAMLRDYAHLLRDDPAYAERARLLASKVRDISEVLLELGLPEMNHPVDATVTYHDACHLAHAQRVTLAPRLLLSKIPGLRLVPLPESDICCGAAGTYNLTQPEMATELAQRKLRNIESTGAPTVVAGNVGCAMHIQSEAALRNLSLSVVHPVELLHAAIYGPSPA